MSYAGSIIAFPSTFGKSRVVFFNQKELGQILNTYGRMVSAGLVKDYAINESRGRVAFSFFQRASERPTYTVVKDTRKRGGSFLIVGADGRIFKRGNTLEAVLQFFDSKMIRLIKA